MGKAPKSRAAGRARATARGSDGAADGAPRPDPPDRDRAADPDSRARAVAARYLDLWRENWSAWLTPGQFPLAEPDQTDSAPAPAAARPARRKAREGGR